MLIANPIYDSVFKSLMEDSTIAKQLLVYANSSEELQRQIDAEDEVETILLKHERVIEVQNLQLEAQNQQLKKQQEQMESLRKKLREAGFEVD